MRHRTKLWLNYVNKYGVKPIIIESGLSKEDAIKKEKFYIKKFGRADKNNGTLLNLTDGGEGAFGAIRSKEIRERMSIAAKNRKKITLSESHKRNIGKAVMGKNVSEETKRKISEANKENYIKNNNMGMRGKRAWNKGLKRNVYWLTGKGLTDEHKKKISEGNKGRRLSEETKKKISEAHKAHWERIKAA